MPPTRDMHLSRSPEKREARGFRRRGALPSSLRELADRAEAGLSTGENRHELAEKAALLLEEGVAGPREAVLFNLRLEARGRAEAFRVTAEELERREEFRWRLMQSLLYPGFLSLFLAVALVLLWIAMGSAESSVPGPGPVEPGRYLLLFLGAVLIPASFPLTVWGLSRERSLPGAYELLRLLREALLTAPSLGVALRRLRNELHRRGFLWEALDRSVALILEGAALEEALFPFVPPLTGEELARISTHPERAAAIATLTSLIRYRELRNHTRGERAVELLPAGALLLVGVELLLILVLVVLPLFEMLLRGGIA